MARRLPAPPPCRAGRTRTRIHPAPAGRPNQSPLLEPQYSRTRSSSWRSSPASGRRPPAKQSLEQAANDGRRTRENEDRKLADHLEQARLRSGSGRTADDEASQAIFGDLVALAVFGIALTWIEGKVVERGLEHANVLVERIRIRHQDCAHDPCPAQDPDAIVDADAALRAELGRPFEAFGARIVVRRNKPALERERRVSAPLAFLVAARIAFLERLQHRIGVDLLVILDVAGVFEIKDGEPVQIERRKRIAVLVREIAHQSEKLRGVGRTEETVFGWDRNGRAS